MSIFRTMRSCALLVAGTLCASAGCASVSRPRESARSSARAEEVSVAGTSRPAVAHAVALTSAERTPIAAAAYDEPESLPIANVGPANGDDPFASAGELTLGHLVSEVHRRNPTLQAAVAAWASAAERYPQAVALDDPMLQSMFAPGSFPSSSNIQSSYYVGLAQRVPWWGKRGLRGQIAQAQAAAAAFDSKETELRLTEVTRVAFFDYYLVVRELELNGANEQALREFRGTANTKYEANLVTQQDVLQADVELAKLESRRIELEQNQRVAIARINTLLHRLPDHRLPPPPAMLEAAERIASGERLRDIAIAQRPELAAQGARIEAEQAQVALACKEFFPDFEFMGRYDQFWTDVEQRPQIGMNVNVPLNQTRRKAAVREAMFRLNKMQAEYQQQVDDIRHDVEAGLARLEGSRRTVALYVERILPAARANVESASAGYVAGAVDFLRLVEAQREVIELQEKHQEAIAAYHRRLAELERVVGSSIPSE